ncbi:MAG: hypothetical protein QW566_11220 [Candidatus Jordarchaeales archaeon]
MAHSWHELRDEIRAEALRIWFEEPDELKKIRLGVYDPPAGAMGQYFTTWDFVVGMVRDLAMSPVTPILKLVKNTLFELDHLKAMVTAFLPIYTEFLGYCGLRTLKKFTDEMINLLPTIKTKEEFYELLSAYSMYCNKLQAWCVHYFPFALGFSYKLRSKEEVCELARLVGLT